MHAARVEPNVFHFNAAMRFGTKNRDLQEAEHWHAKMVEAGIWPDVTSLNSLINSQPSGSAIFFAQ